VSTFWDLGRADMTSIWFAQVVGFEFRLIDFYQSRGHAIGHYLKVLGERPYAYDEDWLPHDARHQLLGSERTIEQQMKALGRNVRITPRLPVAEGINAARTIFNRCWFDQERCADGLSALRRYRYDVDEQTGRFSPRPLHDDASHAADAFRYLAVALQPRAEPKPKRAVRPRSWMG
jgi:phage terminase large subunit